MPTDDQLIKVGHAYMAAACSGTVTEAVAAMRAALEQPALTRYSAAVEHGEVHHEPDPNGMWVLFDDLAG